jgi:hypothetical protein
VVMAPMALAYGLVGERVGFGRFPGIIRRHELPSIKW